MVSTRTWRTLCIAGFLFLVTGCASNIPPEIRTAIPDSPDVSDVRKTPQQFEGAQVRWGGVVAGVENREQETWLEVVARELDSSGRPRSADYSPGRFITIVPGFLDPSVYEDGREVTVNGVLQPSLTRKIDDFEYEYPVVKTDQLFLWEPVREYSPHYPYYWYDPWYYPYPYYYRHPYYW